MALAKRPSSSAHAAAAVLGVALLVAFGIVASSSLRSFSLRGGGDPNANILPHRSNRHLFSFSNPSCSDADYADAPYYVSPSGNNWSTSNGWGLSRSKPFKTIQHAVDQRGACQTVYVMEGTYQNTYYGRSYNHNNKVVDLDGVSDLKLLADPEAPSMPLIQFDGTGGIVGGSAASPLSDIEIAGLDISGPNAAITYGEAYADRLIKRKYYTGRGIAIWGGHHIYIHDMKVHHCPGSGIRVNRGDYVTIADSEVYSNTWWSSSAESAIVLAEGAHVDDVDWVKMRLVGNRVYDNVNKIPYYNPNYAWDYSPIGGEDCSTHAACERGEVEGCPWECRYGKRTQDYIIDGMGVYVTRNKDTYLHGQMELADNVAYGNGINGVVFHRTNRGVVRRNVVYGNGVVPHLEYPEPVVEDWMEPLSKGRQPYSGIVLNNAEGVKLWSNRAAARYDDDYAYNVEVDGSGPPPPLAAGGNNKVCQGLVDEHLMDVVSTTTDASVCGEPAPATAAPTMSPTASPTVIPNYLEVSCGARCHLIQWPYNMGNTYAPSVALASCAADCDNGDCKAFSVQDDYRPGNEGLRWCFLYQESAEPSPAVCAVDPFNGPCTYSTSNGEFFITPFAKAQYNVNDLA